MPFTAGMPAENDSTVVTPPPVPAAAGGCDGGAGLTASTACAAASASGESGDGVAHPRGLPATAIAIGAAPCAPLLTVPLNAMRAVVSAPSSSDVDERDAASVARTACASRLLCCEVRLSPADVPNKAPCDGESDDVPFAIRRLWPWLVTSCALEDRDVADSRDPPFAAAAAATDSSATSLSVFACRPGEGSASGHSASGPPMLAEEVANLPFLTVTSGEPLSAIWSVLSLRAMLR